MAIYQFVAELKNFKPRMWRRFVASSDMKLSHFAYAVMHMFGCQYEHLFSLAVEKDKNEIKSVRENNIIDVKDLFKRFKSQKNAHEALNLMLNSDYLSMFSKETYYELPNEDLSREFKDIRNFKVADVFKKVKDKARLDYDFGDGWEFKIVLEKILDEDSYAKEDLPLVLKGKVKGIIEDCGGPWALQDLVEKFPKTNEATVDLSDAYLSEDELDWFGEDLENILDFDVDEVNGGILDAIECQEDHYESQLE